jgi:hypothetical protein
MRHYFATDGSYGDAAGMLIVDTSLWNSNDWAAIEEASDEERNDIVQSIMLQETTTKENNNERP